jgi:hypothetical protein
VRFCELAVNGVVRRELLGSRLPKVSFLFLDI